MKQKTLERGFFVFVVDHLDEPKISFLNNSLFYV